MHKLSSKLFLLLLTLLFGVSLIVTDLDKYFDTAFFEPDNNASMLGEKSDVYVYEVVDGDTIKVMDHGIKRTVRLIGIDTPETVHPRKTVECFGSEAATELKSKVLGKDVTLVDDPTQGDQDRYGRLLRYVLLSDGTNINKHMIEEGYAYEYTYREPYYYQEEFKKAQKNAQRNAHGLWKEGVCD